MSGQSSNWGGGSKKGVFWSPRATSLSFQGSPSFGWLGTCWRKTIICTTTTWNPWASLETTYGLNGNTFLWTHPEVLADLRSTMVQMRLTSQLSSRKTASCASLLCSWLMCLIGLVRASAYSKYTQTHTQSHTQQSPLGFWRLRHVMVFYLYYMAKITYFGSCTFFPRNFATIIR